MPTSRHMQPILQVLVALALVLPAPRASAAEMILNEYNAVSPTGFLNGGTAEMDSEGGAQADPLLGRTQGNGNDWFELVVVADGLDISGWRLDVCNAANCTVQITFSNAAVWSNLRAGTLITIAEEPPVSQGPSPVTYVEDASYDPTNGDWWIHVIAGAGGTGTYVTATPFDVTNSNWQLVIRDSASALVYGPAGEGIVTGVGVGSDEVFKLEEAPSALTFPSSSSYNDGVSSSFGAPNLWSGGVGVQDLSALRLNLPIPDRDLDGIADDGDFDGLAGFALCNGGTSLCDDNCPFELNPTQTNAGDTSAGDACECGDADDDGTVTTGDWDEVREFLVGLIPAVAAPEKCAVTTPALCNLRAAVGMERASADLPPAIQPVCSAAAAPAAPSDVLFDPDRVLNVVITMENQNNPDDWETLRQESRDVYDTLGPGCMDGPPVSPYTEFPAFIAIDGSAPLYVAVRKKGFYGSADLFRPSLKVDTNQYVGGQLIAGLENLTFNNARQDPALVKQCLGYALFAAAGLPASRCNFARVTVNGQFLGIYVHVEEIEQQPYLARYFANTTGNIYEGTLSDFRTTFVNTFERKNNEENPDQSDLAAIVTALQVPDAQLAAALEPLVNLDAFYTYWAMEGLIGHWDGYQSNRNNYWVYFDPGNGGRMNFLPWGIDALFANGNPFAGGLNNPAPVVFPRAMLARRLYLEPTTRNVFLGRVQTLLNTLTVWNETALNNEINRMEALLEANGSGTLDTYLAPLRTWINGRRAVVQTEISGGGPAWTAPLDSPACLALAGTVSGNFNIPYGGSGAGAMTLTLNSLPPPSTVPFFLFLSSINASGALPTLSITGVSSTAHTLVVSQHPALFEPGTLPLGGALVPLAETTTSPPFPFIALRLMVNGSITFSQASSTPGQPVVGSYSGNVAEFTPLP